MRKLIYILIAVSFCFLLQAVFPDLFLLFKARPDFLLIIVVLLSHSFSCPSAGLFGLACGLLQDAVGIARLGTNGLAKSIIAISVNLISQKIYPNKVEIQFVILFFATLIQGIILFFVGIVFQQSFPSISSLLIEGLYNGIFGVLTWRLLKAM
ncbi:MAG: rod shape-determining protein MreD [bacterium]|nr:rod shape-determining protein MreD [bacterium]